MHCKKIFFSFLIICLLPFTAIGQAITLRGVTYKKTSSERVAQALVTDLKTQVIMMSDELGMFSIKTNLGDTLLFTKANYTPQKKVVTSTDDIAVFLQPAISLNQVTISGQTKKQELNEVMDEYRNNGVLNNGKSLPAWEFINSPITGLYQLFAKQPADARRFARFSKNELEATEVNRRYTKALVKRTTNMSDEDVVKFMTIFTPSYEDVKGWNDYELIAYIKKSYGYYQRTKGRDSVRMQKLY